MADRGMIADTKPPKINSPSASRIAGKKMRKRSGCMSSKSERLGIEE